MFRWLKWLFAPIGFDPGEAEVYRYHDGKRSIRGDPMAILRRLAMDDNFDIDREIKLSAIPGKPGFQAYDRLMSGIRAGFEIPPCKEGGLTDVQCAALLADFQGWVQKKSDDMPPSPPSVPDTPDSPDGPVPMQSSSDSSSTTQEQSPSSPCPSSPVSAP
jgi:hypothetical protein